MKYRCALLVIVSLLIPTFSVCAQRPLMQFEAGAQALSDVFRYSAASDDELRELVLDGATHRHPATRLLHQIMPLRASQKNAAQLVDRLLDLGLEASDSMDLEELLGQIDDRGALNPKNNSMKFQAYYYAMRYHVTGNENDAQSAVHILRRFAEVIGQWPLVDGAGNTHSQNDTRYLRTWDANGLWGVWYYQDLWACQPLLWAWDLVGNSQALQEPGVSEHIEKDLLRYMVEHQFKYDPPTYGNLEHYILEGLIDFGRLLPEPSYIHRAVMWHNAVIMTQFYADGFWHEGTPAYHKDIWQGVTVVVPGLLKGYSDPPGFRSTETYEWVQARKELQGAPGITIADGGARFDDLDLNVIYASQFRRMEEAVNKLLLPDRTVAGLHDCLPAGYKAWWAQAPAVGKPHLLGSSGHGILGTGGVRDQAYVHLHYGGTHGHEHYDALSMILWAKDHELMSEGMYRPLPGDISTREWHTSTAAHNTVVIDESDQGGRFGNKTRRITPIDAVPGIPDARYRSGGHGNSDSDGELLMFETTFDDVQVIEAGGEKSYYTIQPDVYRRTLALVKTGAKSCYVVDIFRVKGGSIHDWMLHGPLDVPYDITFQQPMEPRDGTLHTYLRDLESYKTDQDVYFEIQVQKGPKVRAFLMGQETSEIILAQAPAMRRMGTAPFIDVRHVGPESIFVAIYEPTGAQDEPLIRHVEFAQVGDDMSVGILVELMDGTKDIILSTMDEGPWIPREIDEWGVGFSGRFGHARLKNDKARWLYLVRGESLAAGGAEVKEALPYTGQILSTTRTEDRAPRDSLTTDMALPEGDELKGRALIMDMGGELVQGIIVDSVEPLATGSLILTRDDPGVSVEGNLVRLEHFPNWGIRGDLRFLIENPQLAMMTAWIMPRQGDTVQGRTSLALGVSPPSSRIVDATVLLDDAVIYRGSTLPDDLEIDTRQLAEGRHTLMLEAFSDTGLLAEASSSFIVKNRWQFDDPLDAPVDLGWFFGTALSLEKTVDASDGWAYDRSNPDLFFGDESRRVRQHESEEYLIWETEGILDRFDVTIYAMDPHACRYIQLAVSENGAWKELDFDVQAEKSSTSDWTKIVLTGTVEGGILSEQFRLRILPRADAEALVPDSHDIQVGHVTLHGLVE